MLFFNKLLPLFVLPIGWVALLVIVGAWRKKRWPIFMAIVVLYLASIPFVGERLLGWIESRYPALPVAAAGPADAIVVLGGMIGPRVEPGFVPNFTDAGERFEAGVALVQARRAGILIFTAAGMNWNNTTATEGDELKRLAIARGVPAEQVLVAGNRIGNTADEAAAVAALGRERAWKHVILVTTAWHMPRAAFQFKKAGVDFAPFPVDFRFDRTRRPTVIDFIPRGEAWMQTETALRETYGYWFYRIFR
jgi:uncharacterized SAM-binding protein YcdF (DUF218 family)